MNVFAERRLTNGVLEKSLLGWLGIFIVTLVIIAAVAAMNSLLPPGE